MSTISRLLSFLLIIGLLAACDNQQAAETLPTLAILPSPTITETPTITPTPSETPTEIPSNTPVPTDTPTSTNTPTSTVSSTPTQTFTPSVTATSSLTPTFTATNTATHTPTNTPTNTPINSATPSIPVITFFQSNLAQAAPGAQVTLRWSASADNVQLLQIDSSTGTAIQTFVVAAVGSQIVTLPTAGSQVTYRLVASRGGQQTTTDIVVTFTCTQTWFFTAAAPGGDCPTGSSVSVVGSYQNFERGVMFMYTNQSAVKRVCGLQNEQNRYVCYDSGWDGVTEPFTDSPPTGLKRPDDHFNWAFASTTSSNGTWVSQIGWSTDSSPDNNPVTVQYDTQNRLYVRIPSGTYFLNGTISSGTWTRIE